MHIPPYILILWGRRELKHKETQIKTHIHQFDNTNRDTLQIQKAQGNTEMLQVIHNKINLEPVL